MHNNPYCITVVTGTRAEFGLLLPVMRRIQADRLLSLRLVVTGSHLCHALGYTIQDIMAADIPVDAQLDILLDDPATPNEVALVRALEGFSQYFKNNRPDLLVVLGDRYEIFAAVTAAAMQEIPVAHIAGGETTEGARDEFFRHCITKMSALHFAATKTYRDRILQLGESPERVFNAGSLGAENILTITPIPVSELSANIGFDLSQPFILCTYHPETLGGASPTAGLNAMLDAFDALDCRVLFTAANADDGGDEINKRLLAYCENNPRVKFVANLGVKRYLSALRYAVAVCGNSSSAIVEAPTLHKPAVNIGDRQKGRLMGANTVNCAGERDAITTALRCACAPEFIEKCSSMESPYGSSGASRVIVSEIKSALARGLSTVKSFYDLPPAK